MSHNVTVSELCNNTFKQCHKQHYISAKALGCTKSFYTVHNIAAFGQNEMKCLRIIGQRLEIFNWGHSGVFYGMAIPRNREYNISDRTL